MSHQEQRTLSPLPSTKRLFFALWPDEDVIQKIKQQAVKYFLGCQGKILIKSNWHITLAYFGVSDAATQTCLEEHAEKIKGQPFELNLTKCGFWSRPKVAWLAPEVIPGELKQLTDDLQHAITPCGFKIDTRDYFPHITLVRKAKCDPSAFEINSINMKVSKFCLVESTTYPEGANYEVLKCWDL